MTLLLGLLILLLALLVLPPVFQSWPKKRRHKRRYTWTPDHTDPRDRIYAAAAVPVSPSSDLAPGFPEPFDQGQLGSCTGNGWAGFLAFLHRKLTGDGTLWSRLMIYWGERWIEGTIDSDGGAMIRTGAKFLAKYGVCSETLWPYAISRFKLRPPTSCWKAALPARISEYSRITDLQGMLACLSEGYPVIFGVRVYESFESDTVAKSGIVPMPDTQREQCMGGHCMVAVGHSMAARRIKVRNSWGTTWGDRGYCYLPFEVFTTPGLVDDMWTVRK